MPSLVAIVSPCAALLAALCAAAPLEHQASLLVERADALFPHDVQGPGFTSSRTGSISNLQGVITGVNADRSGCFLQTPNGDVDSDERTSEAIYVFDSSLCGNATVGDNVQIGRALVTEYRRATSDLRLTEIVRTSAVSKLSSSAAVAPIVIGEDRSPPTQYIGTKNPFALPSNTTSLESGARRSSLDVSTYGADFWESLEGMLVTITSPTVLGPLSNFDDTYILPGNVAAPSRNDRGGVTLAADLSDSNPDTRWDSNPQAIEIVTALDGTILDADVVIGDQLADTTGIISYSFGSYTFIPLTAPAVQQRAEGQPVPSPFTSTGQCEELIVGTYNVENLGAPDERTAIVGAEISSALANPDIVVLNEIQDNDGATDDGVVSADQTLSEIVDANPDVRYNFTTINPVDGEDGGQPGGNIRPAFLYRPDHIRLVDGIPKGDSTTAVDIEEVDGRAQLTLNPGRIEPSNSAWESSRKAIIAQFTLASGGPSVFVVGVHFTSKGGSTSPAQNPQAPVNNGVEERTAQAQLVRDFAARIRAIESDARIIVTGDLNEFSGVQPLEVLVSGNDTSPQVLAEALISERTERYTYIFQQNSQQLDHILASPEIAAEASVFVPHINTWKTVDARTSDHDPILAKVNVC